MTVSLIRDPYLRRRGAVYGYWTRHPVTGCPQLGYVGQTFQTVRARDTQHRTTQPWADLIVGPVFVIQLGVFTIAELDAVERHHIARLRPIYNFEHNLANPDRVPLPEAVRQRQRRDLVRGRPMFQPVRASRPPRAPRRATPRPPSRSPFQARKSMKSKLIRWGGLALLVLYVTNYPAQAAGLGRAAGGGLLELAAGFGAFVSEVFG